MATQQEYVLDDETVILSTSDLQGTIVDYNTAFRVASGYSDQELKNQPHNILRHSDMPKEAFKDFWSTIQSGKPWFGIVKNKRKNGDYYWVAANASPIIEKGKITGYLSVRYPATRAQINDAQTLYQNVKAAKTEFPWTKTKQDHTWLIALVTLLCFLPGLLELLGVPVPKLFATVFEVIGLMGVGYAAYRLKLVNQIPASLKSGIEAISNGQYRQRIEDRSEWGMMLNMIRSRVGESAAKNYDQIRAAEVMNTAVQLASTNMMIADKEFNIVSINQSLSQMFAKNEAALHKVLPAFEVNTLIGANMDVFHANPAHQRHMVAALTTTVQTDIKVAGLIIRLTVTPITYKNERLGYVAEWIDRTEEALMVEDINAVADALSNGQLDRTIQAEANGAFLAIKTSMNQGLTVLSEAIAGVTQLLIAQSAGDLTQNMTGEFKGQFAQLQTVLNDSTHNLNQIIGQAAIAASIVGTAADEVAQAAADLSDRVQQQAAAVEQTSATMDQMNSAVQANTENAQHVVGLATDVQDKTQQGAKIMHQTIQAMKAIEDSSHKISDIVTLIDSIAFQTNLLALNAAVEAARAGEHGRGFAVVAGEVRNLAQKSAEAAKDIKILIEETTGRISQGSKLAMDSGDMLQDINQSIKSVNNMITQIANASLEQAQGISQVHQAITQIDDVTQQNAALVEETTATAESMKEQAEQLSENMRFFKTL